MRGGRGGYLVRSRIGHHLVRCRVLATLDVFEGYLLQNSEHRTGGQGSRTPLGKAIGCGCRLRLTLRVSHACANLKLYVALGRLLLL